MSHSAFLDRSLKPDDAEIFKTLGPKVKYWKELKQHIEETYGPVTEEWKFYSKKSGWTLKVLLKKRNLFFFIPLKDHFLMTFIFGDKAVSAVEKDQRGPHIVTANKRPGRFYSRPAQGARRSRQGRPHGRVYENGHALLRRPKTGSSAHLWGDEKPFSASIAEGIPQGGPGPVVIAPPRGEVRGHRGLPCRDRRAP